jgi:protein transport protein SEC61 subunit alpha
MVHFLFTKDTIWQALSQAFTRQNGYNLSQLTGSVVIFCVLVFLQGYRARVKLINQKAPGYETSYPVKLFFTSNMSVILQSMVISNFYKISQSLHDRFYKSALIKLIGTWSGDKITGGLLWYISPPSTIIEAFTYPHRTILYTIFVCFLCALFSKLF